MSDVDNRKLAVVFGGSSGIGEGTARSMVKAGLRVVIVGRDPEKLESAARRLERVERHAVDANDAAALETFFGTLPAIDRLVVCVSGGKGAGPFVDLDLKTLAEAFEEKLFAQLRIAQKAARHMRPDGSITFVSAASASSVIRGTSGLAAVNGALECMIPILAYELAPLRVNAVSPGIVDTPWWNGMPAAQKEQFFQTASRTLPVGRVGEPNEVGALIALVAESGFATGSVFTIDGGSHLITQ